MVVSLSESDVNDISCLCWVCGKQLLHLKGKWLPYQCPPAKVVQIGKTGWSPYLYFRKRCKRRFQDSMDWAVPLSLYPKLYLIIVMKAFSSVYYSLFPPLLPFLFFFFQTYTKKECNVSKTPMCFWQMRSVFYISYIFGSIWIQK